VVVPATAGRCDAAVTFPTVTFSDNCQASLQQSAGASNGSTFGKGVHTIEYSAGDGSLVAMCDFDVEVVDSQQPSVTCPGPISVFTAAGMCGRTVDYTVSVADNCAGVQTTVSGPASGAQFAAGVTTVQVNATDAVGLMESCTFSVTVVDDEDPAISCPANITVDNDADNCGALVSFANATATDNCGAMVAQTGGLPSGSRFPVGVTQVSFAATDGAGRQASCWFAVRVVDNQPPTVDCGAAQVEYLAAGSSTCGIAMWYAGPTGADNCPGHTVSQVTQGVSSGDLFAVGSTNVTWQVTDAAGNQASCVRTITVVDNVAPVIVCPSNQTYVRDAGKCNATVTYTAPVGTDVCGATTTQTRGLGPNAVFGLGMTAEEYTVVDASGNVARCVTIVDVMDEDLPEISCPANVTVNSTAGSCGAVVTYAQPQTLECSLPTTGSNVALGSGALFPVGVTQETYTVRNVLDSSASCSLFVTVVDVEAPTISCPSTQTLSNSAGQCSAVVAYTPPMGIDNCAAVTTTLTGGVALGSALPVGQPSTQQYTATDAAGYTAVCSFVVAAVDTEMPLITCPSSVVVPTDADVCTASVNFSQPTTEDNCGVYNVSQIAGPASGSAFALGTTSVTFLVVDTAGNSAQCTFQVVVEDRQAPALTCPASWSVDAGADSCGAMVSYPVTMSDNCLAGQTLMQQSGPVSSTVANVGAYTVSFSAFDAAGLSTNCSFPLTIVDVTPPTITCPQDFALTTNPGKCFAGFAFTSPQGQDNCPGTTTRLTSALGSTSLFPLGTTEVSFVVTDASGLNDTCSFNVDVSDDQAPLIGAFVAGYVWLYFFASLLSILCVVVACG
jgi:large repetitive protein